MRHVSRAYVHASIICFVLVKQKATHLRIIYLFNQVGQE